MVVILIIGVLIAILIPVATKIKIAGYKTTTLAQINALRSAIEAYQGTYNAYPGPVVDLMMFQTQPGSPPLPTGIAPTGPDSRMTQSENMVLGLLGGLRFNAGTGMAEFNPSDVGNGPRSLNPNAPGQHQAFITDTKNLNKYGFYSDRVDNAGQPAFGASDSSVPEFLDTFTEPLPIIYLRARKGATGVMSDEETLNAMTPASVFQYDVRQYYSYIAKPGSPPTPIVVAGKLQAGDGKGGGNTDRGLHRLGTMDDKWVSAEANSALSYFKHPSLNPAGTANAAGTPRNKDSFILISAGADRIFGTNDDLTSFGTPGPE